MVEILRTRQGGGRKIRGKRRKMDLAGTDLILIVVV
jgi:hypothetical protein